MRSPIGIHGYILVLCYMMVYLCAAHTNKDKYSTVEKRIFCNPSGCHNGKRSHASARKYDVIASVFAGKRDEVPLTGELDNYRLSDMSDNKNELEPAFQQEDVLGRSRDSIQNSLEQAEIRRKGNNLINQDLLTVYENFKALRDAEEILQYIRGSLRKHEEVDELQVSPKFNWYDSRKK